MKKKKKKVRKDWTLQKPRERSPSQLKPSNQSEPCRAEPEKKPQGNAKTLLIPIGAAGLARSMKHRGVRCKGEWRYVGGDGEGQREWQRQNTVNRTSPGYRILPPHRSRDAHRLAYPADSVSIFHNHKASHIFTF